MDSKFEFYDINKIDSSLLVNENNIQLYTNGMLVGKETVRDGRKWGIVLYVDCFNNFHIIILKQVLN